MDTAYAERDPLDLSPSPSFWVRFWTADIKARFARDPGFQYWLYETFGDLQDVGISLNMPDGGAEGIERVVLRLNEQFFVEIPLPDKSGPSRINDVFSKIQGSEFTKANQIR